MKDKNFILALIFSVMLIVVYNLYYSARFGGYLEEQQLELAKSEAEKGEVAPSPPDETRESTVSTGEAPVAVSTVTGGEPGEDFSESPLSESPIAELVPEEPVRPQADTSEKRLVINNGLVKITLTNKGATPTGYILTKYFDNDHNNIDLYFDFDKFATEKKEDGDGDLLKAITRYPLLGVKFPRESFSKKINGSYFTVSESLSEVVVSDKPYTVTYSLTDNSGITVDKSYTFYPDKYTFDFSINVKSNPKWGKFDYSLVWFGLGNEETDLMAIYSYIGPVLMVNGERFSGELDEDERKKSYSGAIPWAALTNKFYTGVGIPFKSNNNGVTTTWLDDTLQSVEWNMVADSRGDLREFTFYLGPKEHAILKEYTNGVYSVIDYGYFDIIAKPLYTVMSFFHNITGNWGWSIILLTCVVKILFFPLSQKSFRSMQKLQKLQPLLKKIQETYKDDKEKLNKALMGLYKEHKVNPLGGCLPMLAQIPIFFALYKVLLESIEMKGAGWILWIEDLSLHDPYYITPVLMGISMLVQQLMTPNTGDPVQRKVMMALPVVFTFMFLTFPAGLVIYWLVNNTLTIIQQWIIYRESKTDG